jgi:hypothetical protein
MIEKPIGAAVVGGKWQEKGVGPAWFRLMSQQHGFLPWIPESMMSVLDMVRTYGRRSGYFRSCCWCQICSSSHTPVAHVMDGYNPPGCGKHAGSVYPGDCFVRGDSSGNYGYCRRGWCCCSRNIRCHGASATGERTPSCSSSPARISGQAYINASLLRGQYC